MIALSIGLFVESPGIAPVLPSPRFYMTPVPQSGTGPLVRQHLNPFELDPCEKLPQALSIDVKHDSHLVILNLV